MHPDRFFKACVVTLLISCCVALGCADKSLTGAAKIHQQTTLGVADGCVIADQAKTAYTTGRIPQNATSKSIVNAAIDACATAKTAFSAVLTAEAQYHALQSAQVTACTATPAAPVDATKCASATSATTAGKTDVDTKNDALTQALKSSATKSDSAKALIPPQ